MGRNKIEIKKIDCAIKRRATFSKRSHGLFKKAKELAVLCDVDVALIVFSPAGKPEHFSNRPRIEQALQRCSKNIQEGIKAGMCSNDKEKCKGGCCESQLLESDNSFLPLSAHWNIPTQLPQVLEASQGREQMQMQGNPFGEMGDPSSIQTPVPRQFGSSEVREVDEASGYMQDQLVGGYEMPFFSSVQSSLSTCGLETNKLKHSSNKPSLQVSEVPIQHMQERNEAGMSSDDKEKLARLESYLLESDDEDPSLSSNAHSRTPMPLLQVVEAPQGREPVQMERVPLVEMEDPSSIQTSVPEQFRSSEIRGPDGALDCVRSPPVGGCEMPFDDGVQPSLFFWDMPGGEAGSYEDLVLATLSRWSPDRSLYERESHIL